MAKGTWSILAMVRASMVLPVPVGPIKKDVALLQLDTSALSARCTAPGTRL